jgi:hypothetical protein
MSPKYITLILHRTVIFFVRYRFHPYNRSFVCLRADGDMLKYYIPDCYVKIFFVGNKSLMPCATIEVIIFYFLSFRKNI